MKTIMLLLSINSMAYAQSSSSTKTEKETNKQELSESAPNEEYTESEFQGEDEVQLTASGNNLGMVKTENGWEAINSKSQTTASLNKSIINRKQFIGNYTVKMNIEGMNSTFYANVSIVKGKLQFIVNEGGSINSYYEETSVKEIQKYIQYDFKANNLDSGNIRTYHFKKKGNRFELKFNY
ncbi:hypothetical protein [Flavobacterium sp. FlaQc-28]|uniref:hypothetical protein n=1 Tax=Flavobacterium sp. FlaQc-28 TaxID=3374178 RepID=UPI003756CA42